ncbi:MAG: GntR family transcriptional regulator [Gammaproteobacteria bacterium]|nr:MAG: GntR family transcriptional regulator [Gammaproteobacteria bacterium]
MSKVQNKMAGESKIDASEGLGEVRVVPIAATRVLKDQVYSILREAVSNMDIYSTPTPPRLDERKLAEELGVSRTPVREALSRLEQEGFVKNIPRRGTFVVRKTRKEVLEVIYVWAALESMAARLATERASDEEIGKLREIFATFDDEEARAHINEYSDTNVEFHQTLIGLGHCDLIKSMSDSLFLHMRSIRVQALKDIEHHRSDQSVIDHMRIIEALEQRDADKVEKLVREHALSLSRHIEQYARYLD